MSYVMFAAICDHCGKRSEEYSNFAHCRECDAHVCPECSSNEDAESGRADCHRCARGPDFNTEANLHADTVAERFESQQEGVVCRGMRFRDEDDAHEYFRQQEIDEAGSQT